MRSTIRIEIHNPIKITDGIDIVFVQGEVIDVDIARLQICILI